MSLNASMIYSKFGWGIVVAHKISVTSPKAKFLLSLFRALGFGLGLGLGLVNSVSLHWLEAFKCLYQCHCTVWEHFNVGQ